MEQIVSVMKCRRKGDYLLNPMGTFKGHGGYVGINPYRVLPGEGSAAQLGELALKLLAESGPTGFHISDAATYRATFRDFDREVGIERLLAFHLNDSKHELGSRRDRHEHIGRGHVGLEAFRLLVNDDRFRDCPMVLETPKGEDLAEDRVNLAVLRSLVAPA